MTSKYVYILKDEQCKPFYIGASKNPTKRNNEHRNRFGSFTMDIVSELTNNWNILEKELILKHEAIGCKLTNIDGLIENKYFCKYKTRKDGRL